MGIQQKKISRNAYKKHFFPHLSWVKVALYLVAIAIYFIIVNSSMPSFSIPARKAMAVFGVASFLWMTNALPLAVTGIVVLILLPISHAVPATEVYSYFGNPAIFFILGAFILASPVMRSGLSVRIAVSIIEVFGNTPFKLLFSVFWLSACLCFVMSEHAVAAMLYPIIMEIIDASELEKNSKFAFAIAVAMAWGAIIGGTATLLGGARAPLAIGILKETGNSISFLQWTTYALPAVLIFLGIAFAVVCVVSRGTKVDIAKVHRQLKKHHKKLGKISKREIGICVVMLVTIALWIVYGNDWGLDIIALMAVVAVFVLKLTNWKEVEQDVSWSIVLMYGSAIALGTALRSTGAANALVDIIMNFGIQSSWLIFSMLIVLAAVLTEAMSNAAAVAVLMPVALVLASKYHINPQIMTVALATSAGWTFMLSVSTPSMAIISNCEYVPYNKLLAWGTVLKIVGILVLLLVAKIYWGI
ncbi:MAG: anion transporter [Thiotrichales bacterium]|nr:MAG: anion transporter [Thiotrichales bacterium]